MLISVARRYLKKYRAAIILLLILEVIQILGTLFLPTLNARVVDEGVANGDVGHVWSLGSIMLSVAIAQIVASIGAIAAGAYVSMAAARDIRSDVFTKVMTFGHRETTAFGTSSLVTRATNDVRQVQQFLTMGMSMMIMAPLMAVGGLVMALLQDLYLSWIIVATVAVLGVLMWFLVGRMVPSFRSMQERLDAMGSVLSQQLSGLRVIRAFVKKDAEIARYAQTNARMNQAHLTVGRWFTVMFPAVMLLINLGTIAVVWFGSHQVAAGNTQVGVVMAFIQYLMLILMGIMMLSFISMMVPRAEVAAGRVLEVLDTTVALDRTAGTVTAAPAPGTIEFSDVTFSYPGAEAPVISEVSFKVPRGSTTAIIGSTGSGKTTILQLLVRLLDPTTGTVRVGGVDVRDMAPELFDTQFGYVPQQPYVFGRSIAENLRVGNPEADDETIRWALDVAQASEFINALEDGLDHQITQGGTNLSGGQRQRLAIAMAVARRAPILIFDDSFSALDAATDRAVRAALQDIDATAVIVTQRVSSAREADQILVMEQGRLVARGTHAQLCETSSVYAEIVESQAANADGTESGANAEGAKA